MAEAKEGTEEGAAAAAAPEAPAKTVFQTMRDKLDDGERIFPDAPAEEAADAEAESDEGGEAVSEEGAEAGEAGSEGEDAGAVGEEEESGEEAAGADDTAGDADDVTEGMVTIELSGRNEGETVEIEVDATDTETVEALRRNKNEGMRREELNRAMEGVQADRDEIEEIDIAMATDPSGFLLNKIDPAFRVQVAKALLLDDDVHAELQEILDSAEDPKERELLRLRLKSERDEAATVAGAKVRAAVAAKTEVRRIGGDIAALVPGDMEKNRAQRFQRAALTVAEEITLETGKYPTRAQIVDGLRDDGLLDRFGIDPEAAPSKEAGTRAGSKAADADEAPAGKGKAQPVEGLKKARARRKDIAGSASTGAGAPGASIELPPSTSVKDRIAEVRKKGLTNVLAGK